MGTVIEIKRRPVVQHWIHKLFKCPSYWRPKYWYKCAGNCGKTLRCYWDGNDVTGHGTDFCNSCARKLEQS